jgi:PEGA domain-containing protein
MPEPSMVLPVSLSASGYEDGLGRRSLEIDRESGAMLERLHLRPELGAFESFLRERVAFTTTFDDDRFARVKGIERDGRGILTIVSQFVSGNRLCDLLEAATGLPAHEATCPSVDAALGFLLEVLPALGSLHESGGHAHGTLAPGRIVLTPASQVVVLDWVFGPAIQRLQFNRRRLWTEFGVATPTTAGAARLDITGDISQASLAAMMIVVGRPLRENEYPDGVPTLVSEVIEIAQIRGSGQFASGLESFLHRTLPLAGRKPHANAAEAAAEVRHIAKEIGVSRCRTALTAFAEDMNRVLAERAGKEDAVLETAFPDDHVVFEDAILAPASPAIDEPPAEPLASVPEITDLIAIPAFDEFDKSIGADAYEDPPAPVAERQQPHRAFLEEIFGPFAAVSHTDGDTASFEEPAAAARSSETGLVADVESPTAPPAAQPEPVHAPASAAAESLSKAGDPIPEPTPANSLVPVAPHAEPVLSATPAAPERSAPPTPPVVAQPPVPPEIPALSEKSTAPATPSSVAAPAVPAPQSTKAQSKRKRRGLKGFRDKLRSNASPSKPPAPPVVPAPPVAIPMPSFSPIPDPHKPNVPAASTVAAAPPVAIPMPSFNPLSDSLKHGAPSSQPIALRAPEPPRAPAPLRLKPDPPGSFNPPPARMDRREQVGISSTLFREQEQSESGGGFPWKLAAAAVVGIIAVIGVGRWYLPSHKAEPDTVETAPAATPPPAEKTEVLKAGSLAISTQPAGAHVMLDGKPVGDSPVTVQGVSPGKHTLTFVTSTGTVKKPIRVEPGKPLSIEVPIYSGWIAVFSPVTLDIAENGKSVGTTEQGRLMLSPGRHQLTFTNEEMGYKTTQSVDIEPGEERSVSLVPTGELSANALPWAEVWMNGAKIGETPLANVHVPLGTHEVVFKNPKFPDRSVTVTVRATAPAVAFVDLTK